MTWLTASPAARAASSAERSSAALMSVATEAGATAMAAVAGGACNAPRLTTRAAAPAPPRRAADTVSAAPREIGFGDVVAVRVVGTLATRETHPEARFATSGGALDAPVFERQAQGATILDEDLGEVAAVAQGAPDRGVEQIRCQVIELHQVQMCPFSG